MDRLKELQGKQLSREAVEQAAALLKLAASPHCSVQFSRSRFLAGVKIQARASSLTIPDDLPNQESDSDQFELAASLTGAGLNLFPLASTILARMRLQGAKLLPDDTESAAPEPNVGFFGHESKPEEFFKKMNQILSQSTATGGFDLALTFRRR